MTLIEYMAKRYRCPHCRQSYATKHGATVHLARCFRSPAVRSCLTCRHAGAGPIMPMSWTSDCAQGVDLTGPRCSACGSDNVDSSGDWGVCECGHEGRPTKYMRVQCPQWEQKS